MEAAAKKYKTRATFVFVYCREAHPDDGSRGFKGRTRQGETIPQATTVEAREKMARRFCDDMRAARRILIDEFGDASVQRRYGGLPNPTVVVDVDGKLALKMPWTDGKILDGFLQKFIANGGRLDRKLAEATPLGSPGRPPK
jgi:Iodothyronine deiodinase